MAHSSAPAATESLSYQSAFAMSHGKLAMLIFMSTEVMFFTAILGSYVVLRMSNGLIWPNQETMHVDLRLGIVNTVILISSSLTLYLAVAGAKKDQSSRARFWLLVTALLAIAFLSIKGWEYAEKFKYGFYPSAAGSLIYDQADETYLSRAVSETRQVISAAESDGRSAEELDKLYQIQSGVVDWTQSKVGSTSDLLMRKTSIQALAYQIYPIERDRRLDQYLVDEQNEVAAEQVRLKLQLTESEAELKIVQAELKLLLPKKDTGSEEEQNAFSEISRRADRLTEAIEEIRKQLSPIDSRLAVANLLADSHGINRAFECKLPVVIPNGKSWVNTYFLLTGFHALHLIIGVLVMVGWLFIRIGVQRVHWLDNFSIYWHFVDLVWLVIFAIVYLY